MFRTNLSDFFNVMFQVSYYSTTKLSKSLDQFAEYTNIFKSGKNLSVKKLSSSSVWDVVKGPRIMKSVGRVPLENPTDTDMTVIHPIVRPCPPKRARTSRSIFRMNPSISRKVK